MNRTRKKIKCGRKQACIALCVVMLVAVAGLFSSCVRQHMNDGFAKSSEGPANNASQEPASPSGNGQPDVASDPVASESGSTSNPKPSPAENAGSGVEPSPPGLSEGGTDAEAPSHTEGPHETEEKYSPSPSQQPGGEPSPLPNPKPEPSPFPNPTPSHEPTPFPSPEPSEVPSKAIVNPYGLYTWDQMMAEAEALQNTYPELIELSSAGRSVEGRELLVIRLGTGSRKILLCGTHHAREYITSSFLMKMVETYALNATSGDLLDTYDAGDLLSKVTLVVVPMVNPDGVNLVNNGLQAAVDQEAVSAMAMVRPGYREWKANINGVDLNRQYPACWEEKSDDVGRPASENYKGSDSATEPEVQAMMALAYADDYVLSASFHAKGEVIYWSDSGTVNFIDGAKAIAQRIRGLTGYDLMPVSEKPSVYGAGFENWFRQEFRRPSFCIELTPYNHTDVPHDDSLFDALVWTKVKHLGLLLADEALKR